MRKFIFGMGLSVLLTGALASAQGSISVNSKEDDSDQGSSSALKLKELLSNKKFQSDSEITDPRMKADAGSLSQFSGKFNLTYFGPMIGDLSAKDQPNPDNRIRNNQTAISGNVGLQYRLTPKDVLGTGTGIKGIYPMQGFEGVQTNTPYFSYSHFSKWHGIQLRQTPEFDIETLPAYTASGEDYGFIYGLGGVYEIPTTRLAVGTDLSFGYYHYRHEWIPKGPNGFKGDGKANNGSVSISPSLKYNFNDRTQFMTYVNVGWIQPRDIPSNPHENSTNLLLQTIKQSAGVSYSFSRDIYIYPYLNFYPSKLALDYTTVNISTVFSIL